MPENLLKINSTDFLLINASSDMLVISIAYLFKRKIVKILTTTRIMLKSNE